MSTPQTPSSARPFYNPSRESTIYQRHANRRAKTLAKKNDPRPAVVRVLSGLPGFRMVVPPYTPPAPSLAPAPAVLAAVGTGVGGTSMTTLSASPAAIGNYSEETFLFTSSSSSTSSLSSVETTSVKSTSLSPAVAAAQAVLAAGVASGLGETVFGRRKPHATIASSPFSNAAATAAMGRHATTAAATTTTTTLHPHPGSSSSTLSFLLLGEQQPLLHKPNVASTAATTATTAMASSQIARAASMASLLFGTRTLVAQQLETMSSTRATTTITTKPESTTSTISLASAAVAGAVVGGVRAAQHAWQQPPIPLTTLRGGFTPTRTLLWVPPPPPLRTTTLPWSNIMSREIVMAMVYFTTYDTAKSWMVTPSYIDSQHHHDHRSSASRSSGWSTMAAGALAGSVTQTLRLAVPSITTTSAGTSTTAVSRIVAPSVTVARLLPTVLRAAPAHALLFCGYEGILLAFQL
jgi:hypothetical protein